MRGLRRGITTTPLQTPAYSYEFFVLSAIELLWKDYAGNLDSCKVALTCLFIGASSIQKLRIARSSRYERA